MIIYEDDASAAKTILDTLNAMRQNRVACDGIIYSEDGIGFVIHRSVMATCSPYFKTLFTTPLRGDGAGEGLERTSLVVPGVGGEILSILVDFAYTRVTNVNPSNVFGLFTAADQFGVEDMMMDCCQFLVDNLMPNNCIGVWNFSKQYFYTKLRDIAWIFILRNFSDVLSTSEELLDQPFEILAEILTLDEVGVRDEFDVWTFIIRWIDRDFQQRYPLLPELLSVLRLGLIPEDIFMRYIKPHPYIENNAACHPILTKTMKLRRNWDTDSVGFPYLMRARMPESLILCIGGWSQEGPTDAIEAYDCNLNTWTEIWHQDPLGARAYHRCVALGNFLYILGGTDGSVCLNSCRRFDLQSKYWDFISPMNMRRCYASCVTLNDQIYIIGGYDGDERLSSAECYDYRSNQWSLISSMTAQRSDSGACVVNGYIYVVGGFNGSNYLNSMEFYDPSLDTWSAINGMLSRRSGLTCIAYGGQCYILGGFNGATRLHDCEVYNPVLNHWSNLAAMNNARSNFAATVLNDCIYVCGGYENDHTIKEVEKFNLLGNQTWERVCSLSSPRSALTACLVDHMGDFAPRHRSIAIKTSTPPNRKRKVTSYKGKKRFNFRRYSGN